MINSSGLEPRPRIMIVDDHEIVRRGLVAMMMEAQFDVVAEAGNVRDAVVRAQAVQPDIMLIDLNLPDGNGLDVVRAVLTKLPETRCMILTAFDDPAAQLEAREVGAKGFVLKSVRSRAILEAARSVALGHDLLAHMTTQKTDDPLATLTPAQRSITELMVQGHSNREIAEQLGVTEKTVKNHVTALLAKLGFARRTQVVAWLIRQRAPQSSWKH